MRQGTSFELGVPQYAILIKRRGDTAQTLKKGDVMAEIVFAGIVGIGVLCALVVAMERHSATAFPGDNIDTRHEEVSSPAKLGPTGL